MTSPRKLDRSKAGQTQPPAQSRAFSGPRGVTTFNGELPANPLPFELLQMILNVFCLSAPLDPDGPDLQALIQGIKGHLYNRDFAAAFGKPAYRQAYALRWSAARALGYTSILTDASRNYLFHVVGPAHPDGGGAAAAAATGPTKSQNEGFNESYTAVPHSPPKLKVVSIGGGAGAEAVALAASHRHLNRTDELEIIAVDNANWIDLIQNFANALTMPAPLSTHASAAAKARPENQPLLPSPSAVHVSFVLQDALSWDADDLQTTFANAALCTIMFTLNELFGVSLPKATAFLLRLTTAMSSGAHLLVVDSPGSYSEIRLGKKRTEKEEEQDGQADSAKRYPMKWLLDHALLEVASDDEGPKWEKVESEDSLWFRIDQKDKARLRYPLELENMRYQLHSYRRL